MKVTLVSPQLGSKDTAKAKDLLEAQGFGVQLERCSESLNDWFEKVTSTSTRLLTALNG